MISQITKIYLKKIKDTDDLGQKIRNVRLYNLLEALVNLFIFK